MSVRSRKPWRIASCAAACGMRWVKPSKATASPSCRLARTASASDRNSGIGKTSNIEEYGFLRPLQVDVEGEGIALSGGDEGRASRGVVDPVKDRIFGVGRGLVVK